MLRQLVCSLLIDLAIQIIKTLVRPSHCASIYVMQQKFTGRHFRIGAAVEGTNVPIDIALMYVNVHGDYADESMFQKIIEAAIKHGWLNEMKEFNELFQWLIEQVTCHNTKIFIVSYKFLDIAMNVINYLPSAAVGHDISQLNTIFSYLNKSKWCQWERIGYNRSESVPTYCRMYQRVIGPIVWKCTDGFGKKYKNEYVSLLKNSFDENHWLHEYGHQLKLFIQNIHEMMVQSCNDARNYENAQNFKDTALKCYTKEMQDFTQKHKDNKFQNNDISIISLVTCCVDFDSFGIE